MDPLTMMMLGSTALSGVGSLYSGMTGKKTANSAAALQDQKEQNAIKRILEAGAQYKTDLLGYADSFDPYVSGGTAANDRLLAMLGLGGDGRSPTEVYRSTPGYDFLQGEGVKALDRSAAARGYLNSGRQSKDLIRFGQGLADTTANNYNNQLQNMVGRGLQATGAQTGLQAQGSGGQLGAETTAANFMMRNAGTVPQGMIAGQNAMNAGITGALGAMNYGVGQYAGQNQLQQILSGRSNSSYAPTGAPGYMGGPNSNGMLIYGPGF